MQLLQSHVTFETERLSCYTAQSRVVKKAEETEEQLRGRPFPFIVQGLQSWESEAIISTITRIYLYSDRRSFPMIILK